MATKTLTNPETGEEKTFVEMSKGGKTVWTEAGPGWTNSKATGKDINIKPKYTPELQENVSVPKNQKMPYGMDLSSLDPRNAIINQKNKYEKSLVGDEEGQRMKEIAANRGFVESMYEGGKNVMKQFDAGTRQSPDWMPESVQKVLDYKIGGDNTKTREQEAESINDIMKVHNKQYDADRIASPISTTLGEMIPYLATGSIGERALLNIGKNMAPKMKGLNIGFNKMTNQPGEVTRIMKRAPRKKDLMTQNIERMVRGVGTGAAEGAGAHDQDVLTSMMGAAAGGLSGIISPLKILDKVPGEGKAGHKAMIKELHEAGFELTPGLVTKNRALQTQEAGMRNSDQLNQTVYNKIDEPNLSVLTNMAGEAIGMPTKGDPMITQKALNDHMGGLKKEFQDLELSSSGRFDKNSFAKMGDILKRTQKTSTRNDSKLEISRHDVLKSLFRDLQKGMKRNGDGVVISGKTYQDVTKGISEAMEMANNQKDATLMRHLRDMKKGMDGSLKDGMGEGTAKQWDDLKDKYAMSKLLIEGGGIKAHGMVNPAGLTKSLMNKAEAERTLTGEGNRIKGLQDMVRYSSFLDDVEGGSLTGLGKADRVLTGTDRGLMKRGVEMMLKPATLFKTNYRLNTMQTPGIGKYMSPMHGISPTATVGFNRALSQSSVLRDYYKMAMEDDEEEKGAK